MGSSIASLNQGTPALASRIPFGDTLNGCDRSCSVAELFDLATGGVGGMVTQYASPNATGYATTISVPDGASGVWLLNTPTASFANRVINLPVGVDGLEVVVSSTQSVTALLSVIGATVGVAAQPVNGAPTTLAVNGFFRLRFDGVSGSWYRIG